VLPLYIYCLVVGNVSANDSYIVPGSFKHRELWMIRLREVNLQLRFWWTDLWSYYIVSYWSSVTPLLLLQTPFKLEALLALGDW